MRFEKGKSGNPVGRNPGVPNKLTGEVKEAFVKAFHFIQKDERAKLNKWAADNPEKFYPLISKLFPLEVHAQVDSFVHETKPQDDEILDRALERRMKEKSKKK